MNISYIFLSSLFFMHHFRRISFRNNTHIFIFSLIDISFPLTNERSIVCLEKNATHSLSVSFSYPIEVLHSIVLHFLSTVLLNRIHVLVGLFNNSPSRVKAFIFFSGYLFSYCTIWEAPFGPVVFFLLPLTIWRLAVCSLFVLLTFQFISILLFLGWLKRKKERASYMHVWHMKRISLSVCIWRRTGICMYMCNKEMAT